MRGSAEVALDALLIFLAANTQRGLGTSLETLLTDGFAALFAVTEAAVFDALESFLDLL